MTRERLEELIECGEGARLEFKETTGQRGEACRTLCGFLNGDGGVVVFGVTRKGRLVGQIVSDETKRDLAQAFREFEPSAEIGVEYVKVDGEHEAIVCRVGVGARRPYVYDGRAYVRVESTTQRMAQVDYEEQLRARRGYASEWEKGENRELGLEDLDLEEVRRTARHAVQVGRLDDSVDTEDVPRLLEHFHVQKGGVLLNAAAALFGRVHIGNYPQCQVKMGWFKGVTTEGFRDIDQQSGHIGRLMDEAMRFCFKHLNLSARIGGAIERTEELEIPAAALREALINAFAHRSYEGAGETVYVAIFDDRVEIRNPGSFPPELNPTKLFESVQERSILKNPIIANVLYLRKAIETWGRGIGVMARECARVGLAAPRVEVRNGMVVTTFVRARRGATVEGVDPDMIQMSGKKLTGLCAKLLEAVRINPFISRRTLSDELGVSERKVREALDLLRGSGYILRQGAEHGGIWRVGRVDAVDVRVNVGVKDRENAGREGLSEVEVAAYEALRGNPKMTVRELAEGLKRTERQASRIVAALKGKAGLRRVGSAKKGEWRFE